MILSIVIPVFNEAESLQTLHQEIREVAAREGYQLDVIFVDDGSRDASWAAIARLAATDADVRGIRFRRNFGKAAALQAGVSAARGELLMTLDADLQDDPHEIPRFLAEMAKGLDVVSGWKQTRYDPWHKVFPSRVFNGMVSWLTGVKLHDHNCGMKCYRREVFQEVRLYGERHRFVPVLAAARGFRVGELVIHHRPRRFGQSKYGVARFIKGFLDLLSVKFLTTYGTRPGHAFGAVGLASIALGILMNAAAPPCCGAFAALGALGFLLFGAQMLATGLLAELVVAQRGGENEPYCIAERIDGQSAGQPHSSQDAS